MNRETDLKRNSRSGIPARQQKINTALNTTRYNKKSASTLVYMTLFLVIFLAFTTFAVDGTIVLSNRAKLQNITEAAALAAASEFNSSSSVSEADIQSAAFKTFNTLKQDSLSSAKILDKSGVDSHLESSPDAYKDVEVDLAGKKVLIYSQAISQPYFLAFLGVTGIKLEAKACAISEELPVKANYSTINWITASAAYLSDILSKDTNLNDTAILTPLGHYSSASYNYSSTPERVIFSLIEPPSIPTDVKPLSLGPGGFITIKLPAPIIDKPGNDLYIKEVGSALEGYMVFAGLDNNPEKPYVNNANQGDGISWINISCSGTSDVSDGNNLIGAYTAATDGLGLQTKFYGSAYFDIGKSCVGGISMAKYIRIIDDNQESAFVTSGDGKYYKAMLYGESSTATAGADIDYVKVLNHVKLVPASSF